MKPLTFYGFLSSYISELSYEDSLNIFKLCKEAENQNPRLKEPLFLYSLSSGKMDILKRASKKYGLYHSYENMFSMNPLSLQDDLEKGKYPVEYQKVWKSFQSVKNRYKTDDLTKELIRQKILKIKKEKQISNYKIYTTLKYNPGNFNDWLKNGSSGKISLNSARKALEYVQNL